MVQLITAGEELQDYINKAIAEGFNKLSFPKEPEPEIIDGLVLRQRLGISEPTLIRWRQKGKIPFLQIGHNIRYDWHTVLKALEQKKKGGNR